MRKVGMEPDAAAVEVVKKYATNGREAVNIVQLAAGVALTEGRNQLTVADVEWVVRSSQMTPRPEKKVPDEPMVGFVNGLAVFGPNMGTLLEIEVTANEAEKPGAGVVHITGVVDEEELGGGAKTLRRKSMARGSVDNVMTVLRRFGLRPGDYDLHINFPGGVPVDGPSAGTAMATAIASAILGIPVDNRVAMTGEVSIHGKVKPVGGVVPKVEAAFQAGATKVYIPKENWQAVFEDLGGGLSVVPLESIDELFADLFGIERQAAQRAAPAFVAGETAAPGVSVLHAEG